MQIDPYGPAAYMYQHEKRSENHVNGKEMSSGDATVLKNGRSTMQSHIITP